MPERGRPRPPAGTLGLVLATLAAPLLAQPDTAEPGPPIVVDQFGYVTDAEKVAVLRDPVTGFDAAAAYTPGATLEVRDAGSDELVFSGAPVPWNGGAEHAASGDRGWWFDFSALETPGRYRIVDPENGVRTGPFEIGGAGDVYGPVLWSAARMFYYNRANIAKAKPYAEGGWTDGVSYLGPGQDGEARSIDAPDDPTTARDLRGGWFDAGDPNKYVTLAELPVHDLLSSYRESEGVWRRYDLQLPESDNGLPDLLDELKWELDWVLRMMNPDGSTHIKMGDSVANPGYASPPSANAQPRFYARTCTSATLAASSMLAHAAFVFREQPGQDAYAKRLEDAAARAWTNAAERVVDDGDIETACDEPRVIRAGSADQDPREQRESALAASVWLYALTGEARYQRMIERLAPEIRPLSDERWHSDSRVANDAILAYRTLPNADPDIVSRIDTALAVTATKSWLDDYGFDEDDLYRAEVPDYHLRWASNIHHAAWGSLNYALADAGIRLESGRSLSRRATQAVHWFHGVNPVGTVWLSSMDARRAERSVNQLHHVWFADDGPWDDQRDALAGSAFGPAPGYVVGGPNVEFGTNGVPGSSSLSPPFGQPAYKGWLDSNEERAPNGEYAELYVVSEPAIYVQAAYVRLLARAIALGFPRAD